MKKLEVRYVIEDRVRIKELEIEGRVLTIWAVPQGIKYEVRYFHNGDAKTVYFFEDELEPTKKAP